MVVNVDIVKLAEDLERQELEAPNGVPTQQVYAQLLAIYLYQNDLCNAKYLWKRIPQSIKSASPELQSIWTVGQYMWKRELSSTYEVLNSVNWSEEIADIMKQLVEKVRNRALDLISQAYSSVSLSTVAAMAGLNLESAGTVCVQRGWTIEPDLVTVHPVRANQQSYRDTSSEDQLYKLTDFVSFLEN